MNIEDSRVIARADGVP